MRRQNVLFPDRGKITPLEMARMVRDVNEKEVIPEERLGNRVLHYRRDLQKLSVAEDLDREKKPREERA